MPWLPPRRAGTAHLSPGCAAARCNLHATPRPRPIPPKLTALLARLRLVQQRLCQGAEAGCQRGVQVLLLHFTLSGLLAALGGRRLRGLGMNMVLFDTPAVYRRKDKVTTVRGPLDLLEAVLDAGKKGIKIQRYKGLGEMDPEQLWETTLNPETRLLKRVEIEDARMASDVTEVLMGTEVPPRKAFIYEHATDAELDI